jgi:hypothetical protein
MDCNHCVTIIWAIKKDFAFDVKNNNSKPNHNHKTAIIDQAQVQTGPGFKVHISSKNAYVLYGVEIFAEPNQIKK